jgi:DNA helicase II / ATP-dependent DNA helicase PcrA
MRKIRLKSSLNARLSERFRRELNDSQLAAATAAEGYHLVLAGPGSGKTRVITYRLAYLIATGVPAEAILLVTFTRRAAREMVRRLQALIGQAANNVWAGTFHHIGNRVLRRAAPLLCYQPNFTILDSEDQRDLLRLAMDDSGLSGTTKMAPPPATLLHLISVSANTKRSIAELITETEPELAVWQSEIEAAAAAYRERKRKSNCMDYDDLLFEWGRLIREFPEQRDLQGRVFRHILVDEMQDTNAVQVEVVESIAAAGAGNLTAVGDDAQSIYRFRGADYDNILQFPQRHPGARIFQLETNYRSTPEIVSFLAASIAHNASGYAKHLVSARASGPLPLIVATADAYEEASFLCDQILDERDKGVRLGQMAVLYRNHYDSILLQGELLARGIPYTVRGGLRFFEQAHIKDVMAHLRVVINPQDEASWRRLLLLLPGIGPAKAGAIFGHIAANTQPLEALESAGAMSLVPKRGKGAFAGFVHDLRQLRGAGPAGNPAAAILAVLNGGYREILRQKYDRPDNRLADIEQFALLAARYDSVERLMADLLLAGDVYGMDSLGAEEPQDVLVLSTVHQAKGLEWSHVFVPRLIEDSFPNRRALDEPGGDEEERRVFYVAVSRAMNELTLTHPLAVERGGRGLVLAKPSRFLTEVDEVFFERGEIDGGTGFGDPWSSLPDGWSHGTS